MRLTFRMAFLFSLAVLQSGSLNAQVPSEIAHPATHFVVVVDRSTSVTAAELAGYAELLSQLAQNVSFGDRITMFVAFGQGRRQGTTEITREMPPARNAGNPSQTERTALEGARASLNSATKALFKVPALEWTDLLTSLRQASEQYDTQDSRRRILLMLSDMLHCVPGEFCLDRKDFNGVHADWLSRQQANGTLPALHNACVVIVGVEQATQRDGLVREFWRSYFTAAGADFSAGRYRYAVQGLPWRDCWQRGRVDTH